jgi:hypothetical protein
MHRREVLERVVELIIVHVHNLALAALAAALAAARAVARAAGPPARSRRRQQKLGVLLSLRVYNSGEVGLKSSIVVD